MWVITRLSFQRSDMEQEYADAAAEEDPEALVETVHRLVPPQELRSARNTFQILMGMVAFRAARHDLRAEYQETSLRYAAAADWVCENFGELIWWDCD